MDKKGVISSVAIALLIGLGIGSLFFPTTGPTNPVTNAYTVTSTYIMTDQAGQNSTPAVMTYYMVCVATMVYGYTFSGQAVPFVPFFTVSTTFVSVTASSAAPGHVVTGLGGAVNSCTYVSTVP